MHEMQLAMELAEIVTEVAKQEKLKKIIQVNLQFGEMIQVVPDIFRFAFGEATRGTLAEDAGVDIEIIPIKLRCGNCLKEFVIHDLAFHCIYCNSTEMDIIHGKEMFVKSIEGE